MANFKRKNTSKRDKLRRVAPLDNWTTPKSVKLHVQFKKENYDC
jgi:hypothetical protein